MTAAMIPILFIELALLALYFSVNAYVSSKTSETFMEEATQSINSIVSKDVASINTQLTEITNYARILQREHENFFHNINGFDVSCDQPVFAEHSNGSYYKQNNNGGSSVIYSADTHIGKREKDKAYYSEVLDNSFKTMVDTNSLIAQVYINTFDNMNRLYPFVENTPVQFGSIFKVKDYNFYYEADIAHNPERKPVWTSAYLDPAGMGWLISCIVPIYNNGFLEGVTGIDITVDRFIKNILNMPLPNESNSFMVDEKGMILAMNDKVEKIMHLKELKEHVYSKSIEKTILKPEEFNILQNPDKDIKDKLGSFFTGTHESTILNIGDKSYLITRKVIAQTNWHLFVLTDMEKLLYPITILKDYSNKVGYMAVGAMILLYLFFFLYFKRRSVIISDKISTPIILLTENTKYVGSELVSFEYDESDIEEIDQLNKNFEDMTGRLEKRTQELIRTEVEKLEQEQESERLLIMTMTDPLTRLYNRVKVDEILDYEVVQSKRYNRNLAVILLDLDHFKMVNDDFGHQVGDDVLIHVAELLRDNTRVSDTVARWGGEEFIIVCTTTSLDEVYNIAEKLRQCIEVHFFPMGRQLTASFGVAQYILGESKESLIKRADDALYEAKKISRNLVVKSRI